MKISYLGPLIIVGLSLIVSGCVVHKTHHRPHAKKVVVKKGPVTHIVSIPRSSRVVVHGSRKYYVHNGHFYQTKNHGHIKVRPPAGLTVQVLPSGFVKIKRNGIWYYHHKGVYLRWHAKRKVYIVASVD